MPASHARARPSPPARSLDLQLKFFVYKKKNQIASLPISNSQLILDCGIEAKAIVN